MLAKGRLLKRMSAYLSSRLTTCLRASLTAPLTAPPAATSVTPAAAVVLALCMSWSAVSPAQVPASNPDIASAPLRFLAASAVKPNLYFILDDSSSMQWSYLGDDVVANAYENAVGYRSSLCNKIYYNPQVSYPVPVAADGSNLISAGTGLNTVLTGNGNDIIETDINSGADSIQSGRGNDSVYTGGGNDTIDLGAGNDTVIGGMGADDITLGTGVNRIIYNDASESTADPAVAGGLGYDVIHGINFASGSGDVIVLPNRTAGMSYEIGRASCRERVSSPV